MSRIPANVGVNQSTCRRHCADDQCNVLLQYFAPLERARKCGHCLGGPAFPAIYPDFPRFDHFRDSIARKLRRETRYKYVDTVTGVSFLDDKGQSLIGAVAKTQLSVPALAAVLGPNLAQVAISIAAP